MSKESLYRRPRRKGRTANLTNDEKRARLIDLKREQSIESDMRSGNFAS